MSELLTPKDIKEIEGDLHLMLLMKWRDGCKIPWLYGGRSQRFVADIIETIKAQLAKSHRHKENETGVNWPNCPEWNQCKDANKHIMTYCEVSCHKPHKHRLDRPDWEKIAEFLYHIKYASNAWLTAPPELKEYYRMECYEILALIPDEEEIRKQGYDEALKDYAWWKDGVQYVGCGVKTLEQAIKEGK